MFHLCTKQSCSLLGIIDCCGGKYLSIYKAYALEQRPFLKRNCIYPKLGNNQLDDTSSDFAALIPLSNRISCRAQHDIVHVYDFRLQQLNYMYTVLAFRDTCKFRVMQVTWFLLIVIISFTRQTNGAACPPWFVADNTSSTGCSCIGSPTAVTCGKKLSITAVWLLYDLRQYN